MRQHVPCSLLSFEYDVIAGKNWTPGVYNSGLIWFNYIGLHLHGFLSCQPSCARTRLYWPGLRRSLLALVLVCCCSPATCCKAVGKLETCIPPAQSTCEGFLMFLLASCNKVYHQPDDTWWVVAISFHKQNLLRPTLMVCLVQFCLLRFNCVEKPFDICSLCHITSEQTGWHFYMKLPNSRARDWLLTSWWPRTSIRFCHKAGKSHHAKPETNRFSTFDRCLPDLPGQRCFRCPEVLPGGVDLSQLTMIILDLLFTRTK